MSDRKGAVISPDRLYRYALWRDIPEQIGERRIGTVLFVMLNPSTADESKPDPTITRCIGFASDWGFARLAVGNLFAYRATDPKELRTALNPIGSLNYHWLNKLVAGADETVVAWGTRIPAMWRDSNYLDSCYRLILPSGAKCLGTTKKGDPRHPLMLPRDTPREEWVR